MDFFEVIEKRYSHKERYLATPVPAEHLEKIARAGLMAPSGGNAQSVNLVILPDRAAMQPLCDIAAHPSLETAPAAIALFTDGSTQGDVNNFEIEDYSAACEHIQLAATALGYSCLWLDYIYLTNDKYRKAVESLLNAPESFHLRVVIPIGLPDGPGSRREKRPLSERMCYHKFK